MSQLLVLAAVVAVAVLMVSEQAREALRRRLPKVLLWGGLGLLALLVVTGRMHWLFAAVGAAGALLARLRPLLGLWPVLQWLRGRQAGAAPQGEQAWIRFRRAADGSLEGEVLRGELAGRPLERLTRDELDDLLACCARDDPQGAALLRAYVAQREAAGARRGSTAMTPEEAYTVLGLEPGADDQSIVAAHRRLMQRLHPDRGGSGELAARVNRAQAVLLGRSRRRA